MSKLRTNTIENLDNTSSVDISDVEIKQESYINLGEYGTISTPVNYNNTVTVDGAAYRLKTNTIAPYTLNGDWAVDAPRFVLVGDAVLRQELADLEQGATMIARGVVAVDSIADLLALPEGQLRSDLRYLVGSFGLVTNKGGGEFVYDPSLPRSEHTGGTVISPTAEWDGTAAGLGAFLSSQTDPATGCFVRLTNITNAYSWGFSPRPDNGDSLRAAINNVSVLVVDNVFDVTTPSETTQPIVLDGQGIGGLQFAEDITGLTIQNAGCVLSGMKFIKAGSFTTTVFEKALVDCPSNDLRVVGCSFAGQHRGLNFSGDGLKVSGSSFSDGIFMLSLRGAKNVSITGSFFTRGKNRASGSIDPQGDGIKITGGISCENITISGNVFFDCYRDAIDLYSGGHRITVTSNIIHNANWKALDIKCRASMSLDGPLMRDMVISGNYIYSDRDQSGMAGDEAYIVIQTISEETPDPRWPSGRPTTKEDVKAYGMRNVKFHGNIVECGYPSLIAAQSSFEIEISKNTLIANSSVSTRVAWLSSAWGTLIEGNTISANGNRLSLTQGNELEFLDNRCYNVHLALHESSGWLVEGNRFIEGSLSHVVGGSGHTIRSNKYSGFTTAVINVHGSSVDNSICGNEFRNNPTAILVSTLTNPDSRNVVKDNISMRNGGGFSNMPRITDSGGISDGNVTV